MFASLATLLALASLTPAALAAPVLSAGSFAAATVTVSTDIVFKAQGFGSDYYKSVTTSLPLCSSGL